MMLRTALQQATRLLAKVDMCSAGKQPVRSTQFFTRMYPPRLNKKDAPRRKLKKREHIYIVESTNNDRLGNMELILTKSLEGVGQEGDRVSVSKKYGRNQLLPQGLALYPSEENLAKYEEIRKSREGIIFQTESGRKTVRQLQKMHLPIPMNCDASWVLTKRHVLLAFRKSGVVVPDDCLRMPSDPVVEAGEIKLHVTVNKIDTVAINATVFHYDKENNDKHPEGMEKPWKASSVPYGTPATNISFVRAKDIAANVPEKSPDQTPVEEPTS